MATYKSDNIKQKMIEALAKNKGIVSDACKSINLSRQTHYDWLKKDPDYKKDCEAASEAAIDYVEGALYKLIKDGNPAAVIFYMKTKARNRGYGEHMRIDQTIKDDRVKIVVTSNQEADQLASLN